MEAIKSFTSLNQSKKLAEILPLGSADMIWVLTNPDLPIIRAIAYEDSEKSKYYEVLPAWSLASLLGVLPKGYSLGKRTNGKYYVCMTCVKHDVIEYDNPVDACYEMIIKLHELNIL